MLELQWWLFSFVIGIAGYCMIVEFKRRGHLCIGVILYLAMIYLLITVAESLGGCVNL